MCPFVQRQSSWSVTVAVGHVAAPVPLLAVPLLAGAAGEKVDQSTLRFLLNHAITVQKVYEEEERRQKEEKEKEEARKALEEFFSSPWALAAEARGSQEKKEEKRRRKKKKRRKKKSPKTSSSACRRVRLPWRCHELYGVSGGGGFCSPDGAYGSVWDSVMPISGIFLQLFPVPGVVGCVCMLNGWFSSKDTICADNYIFFWFKLQACVAVRSGRFFCTATSSSWWTVLLRLCCPGVCLRLDLLCRLRFFTLLGNRFHHLCCASLLSMTWNELESDRSTLDWDVQWDFRVHGSSCGTCRDVLLRRGLRRQLHLLPVHVAGLCRSEQWEVYLYGYSRFKLDGQCRSEKWEVFLYGDSRFMLTDKCRSEKWEVYLYGDFPSWWTVVVWKCCPGVCLRLGFHPIGNGSHHLWVVPPSERGTGMSMPSWHDGFSF